MDACLVWLVTLESLPVDDECTWICNQLKIFLQHKLNLFVDQMKKGGLMLARYRKMTENLLKPADLTKATGSFNFSSKVCLLAPHVPGELLAYLLHDNTYIL